MKPTARADNKTRLAYAGLKISEFGSLDYGRNYGVGYDIGSWTDIVANLVAIHGVKDVFMTFRTTGVAALSQLTISSA